jgi:hypothetical protein
MSDNLLTASVLIEMGYAPDGQDLLHLEQVALAEVVKATPAISWAIAEAEAIKASRLEVEQDLWWERQKGRQRGVTASLLLLAGGGAAMVLSLPLAAPAALLGGLTAFLGGSAVTALSMIEEKEPS